MKKLLCYQFIFCLTLAGFAQKNPCNPQGLPYSSIPGDTTIVLKSGTTLTFNRCEFFDIKDCIEIKDIETPEDMERERLQMFDDRGNTLVSYGMIVINLDSCHKKIFEVPVKFRFRISNHLSCFDTVKLTPLLFQNGAAGWTIPKNITSRIVTINGAKYLEFETISPGGAWNIDKLKNGRPVKFIAPRGYTIHRIKIGIGCPLFYADRYPVKYKRSIKMKLGCAAPGSVVVDYTLYNKNRDTALYKRKTVLTFLKHGATKTKCTSPKRSFFRRLFDWAPKERGEIRRKYYLSVSN